LPRFIKRYRLVVVLGLASIFALVLVLRWLNATKRGGQGPAEPFRVIDGGYPTTAPMIIASIAKLGFSMKDVKKADLERSFSVLRDVPVDIWVTCHARWWGRYRKFVASAAANGAVEPFIDPDGYKAYVDAAETELSSGRLH
jgi:hypothetical protein